MTAFQLSVRVLRNVRCPDDYQAPQVPPDPEEKGLYLGRATEEADSAEAPLLEELGAAGVKIESMWDLVNYSFDYRQAVPILIEWLPKMQNIRVREAIVRALTVKFASPAAIKPLLVEFECGSEFIRWEVGNALHEVADKSVSGELMRLAAERKYGTGRRMIVIALGRLKERRAVPLLVDLLKDPDVQGHALNALKLLNPVEARPAIEPFLTHKNKWFRREAKAAIAKFDRAGAKQRR
jgi:HEAT repeat protein